jgi:hypothetical protein
MSVRLPRRPRAPLRYNRLFNLRSTAGVFSSDSPLVTIAASFNPSEIPEST